MTRFRQISPVESVAAMHPVPDEPKSVLPPCSMLTTSQRIIKRSRSYQGNANLLAVNAKAKTQSMGVHAMVFVVFWGMRIAISTTPVGKPAHAMSMAHATRQ